MICMYLDRGGSGGERVVVSEVNDTETIVTGLTPGVLYTFSVSAENDVSPQDNNIDARSLSATADTQEGGVCVKQSRFFINNCSIVAGIIDLLVLCEPALD